MNKKFKLERKEVSYALIGASIILIWFLYVKDLIAPFLSSMPAFLATIIYHFGIYIGIFLLSTLLISKKTRLKFSFITASIYTGIDLIDTPYVVSKLGILNTSIDYWFTTYDAAFYSIYSLFLHGKLLWFVLYPVTGILLILLIPILIYNPKRIWKAITR